MGKIGTSPVVRWLRIHLPMLPVQVPRVPVLVCALSSHCGQLPWCTETAELTDLSQWKISRAATKTQGSQKTNKIKANKKKETGKIHEPKFYWRGYPDGKKKRKKACEKMFSVISHQVNAKENHNAVSLHTYQKGRVKWKSFSRVRLCHPMDYTVHGILQARILEWVTFPFPRGSFQPRDRTQVSWTAGRFFTSWATAGKKVAQGSSVVTEELSVFIVVVVTWN